MDRQWNWRENQALGRRLQNAKLRANARVEEIHDRGARGLDRSVIRAVVQESAWVGTHENVFVLEPSGARSSTNGLPGQLGRRMQISPRSTRPPTLDDFGPGPTFDALNSFTPTERKRGVHRKFVETAIPLNVRNFSMGFIHNVVPEPR